MKTNGLLEVLDLGAMVGRKQAFALLAGKCSAADAECVREARASKRYRLLGLSWDEFCPKHLGLSRVTADKIIRYLEEFGPQYFELAAVVRITPEDYRRIAPAVTPQGVQHGDRLLEISMHNAPELSQAVQELRQQTETVVVEQVSDDDFEHCLERARRSFRSTLECFDRIAAMELDAARSHLLSEELRGASEQICKRMKAHLFGRQMPRA